MIVLLITTSCAAGTQGTSERSRSSRDNISLEEIQAHQSLTNAYEVVQRLRARWLVTRGRSSMSSVAPVIVFVDNIQAGGVGALYDVAIERVTEIRYYNASDATSRWGTGYTGGAIEVITSRS
jgi:hypothetical protein